MKLFFKFQSVKLFFLWLEEMDPAENVKPPVVPNDEDDDDDGVNKIKELTIDSED